jgi:GntR family transcriptional regulator
MLQDMTLEFNSGIPVYKQIINRVRTEVASGSLNDGDRLPTIRKLTEQLNINPNTVAKAYRELELSGVIISQRGNGSFIRLGSVPEAGLSAAEKTAKLSALYERMKSEASGFGISEAEVHSYINERSKS